MSGAVRVHHLGEHKAPHKLGEVCMAIGVTEAMELVRDQLPQIFPDATALVVRAAAEVNDQFRVVVVGVVGGVETHWLLTVSDDGQIGHFRRAG